MADKQLSYIDNIVDGDTGEELSTILKYFNNIYLSWQGSVSATRLSLPTAYRRKGIVITYNNNESLVTEMYVGSATEAKSDTLFVEDINWQVVPDVDYVSDASLRIAEGSITPELLSTSVVEMIDNSNSTIMNLVDNEDLEEQAYHVIKLKDRAYNPTLASGLGYKILRKNWVNGVNILTKDMISEGNTAYIIRYDYDLNGSDITLPDNCLLIYDGGSICNGRILNTQKSRKINSDLFDSPNYTDDKILTTFLNNNNTSKERTTYELQRDFDLDGEDFTIPNHELLDVSKGHIENGYISEDTRFTYFTNTRTRIVNMCDWGVIQNGDQSDTINAIFDLFNHLSNTEPSHIIIFYFPTGRYPIYKTITLPNIRCVLMGDYDTMNNTAGTLFYFRNGTDMFAIDAYSNENCECIIKNICVDCGSYKVARNSSFRPSAGSDDIQNFLTETISRENVSGIKTRASLSNVTITGASKYGLMICEDFSIVRDCNINQCKVCVTTLEEDAGEIKDNYVDLRLINSYCGWCYVGVLHVGWLFGKDLWIEECIKNGISGLPSEIIGISYTRPLSLNVTGIHMNHICEAAIRCHTLKGNIQGIINRYDTNFAGYTYDQIPDDYKNCVGMFSVNSNSDYLLANITTSNGSWSDSDSSTATCGTVHLNFISGGVSGIINIIGSNNSNIGGICDSDTNKLKFNYIVDDELVSYDFVNKRNIYNIQYGKTAERPALGNNISYEYFDTTLNKPIYWTGSKWVDSHGFDADANTHGASDERPTFTVNSNIGFMYYDDEIVKMIWWNGGNWMTADGTSV